VTHLVLVGPTASGKSAVALAIAGQRDDVELVSADAMQVYRGMDIGTAKVPGHQHLIDIVGPDEDYSVARFQRDVAGVLDGIEERGHRAIVVGGTGLYVRAVTDDLDVPGQWPEVKAALEAEADTAALHRRLVELDPTAADRMEPGNRRRIVRALEVTVGSGRPFSGFGPGLGRYPPAPRFHLAGLRIDRATLHQRIEARFQAMLAAGFVAEVEGLRGRLGRTAGQALGYKEILGHLEHGEPLEACVEEAIRRTKRFARRQEAWFKRDPRITWYEAGEENLVAVADRVLGDWEDRCRP
jgi:tRNA dimethylallyltransferase